MTKSALKKKLHEYIDRSDEKILKAVYTILESNMVASEPSSEYTSDQLKELNKRRKDHLSGKSKSYSFEEIKKYAVSKQKK